MKNRLEGSRLYGEFFQVLFRGYGRQCAEMIWDKAQKDMQKWDEEKHNAPEYVKNLLYPYLALYKETLELDPDTGALHFRDYNEVLAKEIQKNLFKSSLFGNNEEAVYKKACSNLDKAFGEGFEKEVSDHGSTTVCTVKKCPFSDLAKELGMEDGCRWFCECEKLAYTSIQKLDSQHHGSLLEENVDCVFQLTKKD